MIIIIIIIDTAAFLLESALKVASKDYKPLVSAVYFLESAIAYENNTILSGNSTGNGPSTSLLKNAGLGHVNLIQNKLISNGGGLSLPMKKDILLTSKLINWPSQRYYNSSSSSSSYSYFINFYFSWKLWCTERFVVTWGEFLKRPDAKRDPQYETIKKMYQTATSKSH